MKHITLDHQDIKQSYIVCSTGRSGSTLLCRTLEELNFGKPEEYFHHYRIQGLGLKNNPEKFLDYYYSILREGTTSNGVFGIKMHYWQMFDFLKIARQLPEFKDESNLSILNAFFANPKFIYIWRKDMVAQAVSTVIALQTHVWEERKREKDSDKHNTSLQKTSKEIQFQPLKIYYWEKQFQDQNRRWREFLEENEIKYYEVITENLFQNFPDIIQNTFSFLEVEDCCSSITMPTKKQSNEINKTFRKNYKKYPKLLLKVANKVKEKASKSTK